MSARDLVGRIEILKSILIARSTGRPTDDKQYKFLRQELLENSGIRDKLPLFLRYCSDLEGFWNFIQPQSPTYQGRRNYIHQAFEPVLSMLGTLSLRKFEGEQSLETPIPSEEGEKWDLFICHATEDKEEVVRPLVDALISEGFHVWYDEFSLTIGDSLRRSIDKALAQSKYGLVILSPNFFAKNWPQTELDGLAARECDGKKVILPVWHNVDEKYIKRFSPTLADRVAVPTEKGIDYIVAEIFRVIKPSKTKQRQTSERSMTGNSAPEERKAYIEDCVRKVYSMFEDLEVKEIAVDELKRLGARKQLMKIASDPWVHDLIKKRSREALKSI